MKTVITIILLLSLVSCGKGGAGSTSEPLDPVAAPRNDGYTPVAQAMMTISSNNGDVASVMRQFSLMQSAYAATTNVSYVVAENVTFTVNTSGISPILTGDVLDIGTLAITALDSNKLKICGSDGKQKCGQAIIRIYTQALVAWPGVDGFVNTSDGYGVPVTAGKTTANLPVGLTAANSANVQTYAIPNNDNRLTLSDFPTPTYKLASDFSNAGAGSYSMTVVIELALAQ
jgi:hypothetical protein